MAFYWITPTYIGQRTANTVEQMPTLRVIHIVSVFPMQKYSSVFLYLQLLLHKHMTSRGQCCEYCGMVCGIINKDDQSMGAMDFSSFEFHLCETKQ